MPKYEVVLLIVAGVVLACVLLVGIYRFAMVNPDMRSDGDPLGPLDTIGNLSTAGIIWRVVLEIFSWWWI